jgi:hypothetical protein
MQPEGTPQVPGLTDKKSIWEQAQETLSDVSDCMNNIGPNEAIPFFR